jgi:probable addiction module antidote protein
MNKKINQPLRTWDQIAKEELRKDSELAKAYLDESLALYKKDGDEVILLKAMRRVAEAVGVAYVAKQTGLTPQSIYKALSDKGNPTLKTFNAILHALGFEISYQRIRRGHA